MTVRVVWSPSALRQVARIFDCLLDFNPRAEAERLRKHQHAGAGMGGWLEEELAVHGQAVGLVRSASRDALAALRLCRVGLDHRTRRIASDAGRPLE